MSKERYREMIDEAYNEYDSYMKDNLMTKEMFIRKIKFNQWFSEKWGLKIEQKKLSLEEQALVCDNTYDPAGNIYSHNQYNENEIPSVVITVTYKDEKVELYQ